MGGFFSKSQAPDQDKQETNQLSKNARKRLAKDAKWHAQAEGRKAYLKEKRKAVKQRRKENPQQLDRKRVPKIDQSSSGIKVMLDLDFTTLMSRKEISSSARQLSHCYSRNRYPAKNIKMSACGVDGLWTKELQTSYPGYTRWKDFEFSTIPLQEMTGNFCYLTADSPNILADLDEDVTYVIGGIVDRNRYKNLTLNKAEELNIAHARLPLDDFVKMSSRKVLTVNHVFEILLEYTNSGNWKESFLKVMPQRKGAKQINDSGATVQEADHSGDIQEVEVDEIVYTEPI